MISALKKIKHKPTGNTPKNKLVLPEKQRGMATTDFLLAAAGFLAVSAYFGSKSDSVAASGQEQMLVDHVSYIIKGMRTYAESQEDRFASMTCEDLSERNHVNKKWGDCSTANPSGGSYDISNSTVTEIVVIAEGLTPDICVRSAEIINKNFNATCSGDTLTVTAT